MKILPETQLFVSGAYGIVNRPKRRDGDSNYVTVSGGLTGEFAPKTEGTVSIGYTIWDSESGNDADSVIGSLDLTYHFMPRLNFYASASYSIQDFADIDEADEDDFGGTGYDEELRDITSEYSRVTRLTFGTNYIPPGFQKKLSFNGNITYENRDYAEGDADEDKYYTVRSSLTYRIRKWLNVFARYVFRKRITDEELDSYDNNIVTLGLRLQY